MQPNIKLIALVEVDGYFKGFRQPSIIAKFKIIEGKKSSAVAARVRRYQPKLFPGLSVKQLNIPYSQIMLNVACELYFLLFEKANAPYFNAPVVVDCKKLNSNESVYTIVLPTICQPAGLTKEILLWCAGLINQCNVDVDNLEPTKEIAKKLSYFLEKKALYTYNSYNFVRAANELSIPWIKLNSKVMQFGWGKNSHWFSSSIGPDTRAVSVALTSDKHDTTKLLRSAGFPVVPNAMVNDIGMTKKLAQKIGYPVVLKPLNFAGGKGVYCNIQDESELINAFEKVKKLTDILLLEQHFTGKDYRIQTFNGKAYWAVERIPANIIGNGTDNVAALITEKNKQRLDEYNGVGMLQLDPETLAYLANQGLDAKSIPLLGQHIQLCEVANVSKGGEITPVIEYAHPENLQLAQDASELCRIDIAGIDILLPDITRSWKETGAHICEVNSQPQMSHHLPKHILQATLQGNGRIPIHIIITNELSATNNSLTDLLNTSNEGAVLIGFEDVKTPLPFKEVSKQFHAAIINRKVTKIIILYHASELQGMTAYPFDEVEYIISEDKVNEKFIEQFLYPRAKQIIKFDTKTNSEKSIKDIHSAVEFLSTLD